MLQYLGSGCGGQAGAVPQPDSRGIGSNVLPLSVGSAFKLLVYGYIGGREILQWDGYLCEDKGCVNVWFGVDVVGWRKAKQTRPRRSSQRRIARSLLNLW